MARSMQSRLKMPWSVLAVAVSGIVPVYAAPSAGLVLANAVTVLLVIVLIAGLVLTRLRLRRRSQMIRELAATVEGLTHTEHVGKLEPSVPGEVSSLSDELERLRVALTKASSSHEYLSQVIRTLRDALIVTRTDGSINRVNPAAERLFGKDNAELCGLPLISLVAENQRADFSLSDNQGRPRETLMLNSAGEAVPVTYSCAQLGGDDPELRGHVITVHNISERKLAEQRIRYLARIDALTKVPNRMQFQHLLQRALARARRGKHRLALVYMDVDKFKEINDTFGHTAGDLCLETLTTRIRSLLPEGSVIGRLAGDEFGVVLDNLDPARNLRAEVVATTRLLQEAISEPLNFQGHQIYTTVSAGISLYPGDGNNVIDLIRNADAALYRAKRQGGGALDVYHPDMNAAAVDRLMLKSRLRKAFEKNELRVHYQPKVDLRDGSIAGAEALVRWELTDRGLVLPAEFIPLAEESNLILELGEWVLDRVCQDYRSLRDSDINPGRISVNLSLRQLKQRDFISRVTGICSKHGVSPDSLELEITETTLMEDPVRTTRILTELHQMGLRLAIDDFGTGYSSLSALQQFPITTLKIDQSFVRHATTGHDQATIVALIIEMGHTLRLDVVAEGVESEEQLRFLKALNCDYAQGLLFGRVMAVDDFRDLLLDQSGAAGRYRSLFARG